MAVLQTNLAVSTHADFRQIDFAASLSVAVAEVRLTRIRVGEDGHVAGIWRAYHTGHVNLVVALEVAGGCVARCHQHIVVVLCQQRVLIGFGYVCNTETAHPIGPASRRRCEHIVHERPVHQIVALVAGNRQEMGDITLAAS